MEIDDWFASYFSTCPIIRPETLQLLPASSNRLFHAKSSSLWSQYVSDINRPHTPCVVASFDSSPETLDSSTLSALLILLQHRTYEANYRLIIAKEWQGDYQLEPWRVYAEQLRDATLVSRLANLPSTSNCPSRNDDINGTILWHTASMMLTANMQLLEEAAGRSGYATVSLALENIGRWACTPTARRAVLHAAQIFKLLFHRRVSDVISSHAVTALFKSALILSFYLLTVPADIDTASTTASELFDEIDWSQIGSRGMSEATTPEILLPDHLQLDHASRFIVEGGAFSITGVIHPPGYSSCRRVLLHTADLMQTLGKWKSRMFSQILHLLTDDLMDIDTAVAER